MADQERDIHIPFNSGFDDFTDDRWKPDGRISTITNAEWNQEGRLEKRRGFEAFTESGVTVGALASYGTTFVSLSEDHLAIYNPQQDSLTKTRIGTFLDVKSYQAGSFQDVGEPQISIAYSSNVYMVAWSSFTDGNLYACFYDGESKRPLTEIYQVASGTFTNVTAHAFSGLFAIVASDLVTGGQSVWRNPTTLPVHDNWTQETLGILFTHTFDIDAYADGDTIYIVGHPSGSVASMKVVTTLISAPGVVSNTNLAWALGQSSQWHINKLAANEFGVVAIIAASQQVAYCTIDSTPAYVISEASLGFANASRPCIGPTTDATYSRCIAFYQDSAVTVYNDLVLAFRDDAGLSTRVKRSGSTYPRSAPWLDPVTNDLCLCARRIEGNIDAFTTSAIAFVTSDEVENYEVLDAYKIGLKCRYGDIGVQEVAYTNNRPLKTVEVTATKRAWAEVSKVQTMPPAFVIRIMESESSPTPVARGMELAGGLYTSRGPGVFDGLQLTEVGFWGSPRMVDSTVSTTGFLSPNVAYLYNTEWEIQNALGDTMRSIPSALPSVTLTAPDDEIINTYDSISPTNWGIRFDKGSDPYIVQYRTEGGGETLYRTKTQAQVDQGAYNLTPISDTISDTSIGANPVIYTDGAQLPPLEDVLPTCFGDMCVYKNRIIGVGDDGVTLWVSSDKRPTEQVRFNDGAPPNVQIADGGRIYAICAEQDRFICFKENDIYVVYGEGADERGVGASFNLPIPLAQNLGCTRPESVIATPVGTFFQGGPGIMRIVGPNVDFIGNAVRDTFPGNVSAAAHSAEQQKVFFGCHNDDLDEFMILVFDYRFNRWTKWTYTHPDDLTGENLKILGMVVYDNRLHCALGDRSNIIRQKALSSASSHLDYTDTWVTMEVEFAPIKTSGPQGFQHVKKVMVIGEQGSRHNLSVSFANDYDSSYYQTVNWSAAVIDTWTTLPLEQFSAKPSRPRCEAIKVKISDATPSTGAQGTGQGLKLVGLSLTVANKTRLMRLGSTYKR